MRHHAVGKGLAGVATIDQYAFNQLQIRLRMVDGPQCAVPVRHIRRGHGEGVRQALRVHRDVTLDAGDNCSTTSIALFFRRVGVLHTLRVNDQEAGRGVAPRFGAGLANGFFLGPFQGAYPSLSGALHLAKYEYTVTQLGNPSGSMRHWQRFWQVEHGVEDFMQIHRARLGAFAYAFQQGPNLLELFQSDVARVRFSLRHPS